MGRYLAPLAAVLLAASAHASKGDVPPTRPVALLTPIEFADHATAMDWIKSECTLPKLVEELIVADFRKTGLGGDITSSLASGYVVKVVIERANAQKGGGWSGPKTLSVSAKLYGDGVLLRSTESSGEAKSMNMFAGSCASLEKAGRKATPHIAEWLRNVELAKYDHLSTPAAAAAASAP